MASLLITGSGLVGSQVARLATSENGRERPTVYELNPQMQAIGDIVNTKYIDLKQGDVLDYERFERDVSALRPDRIIHTVANPLLTVGAQSNPRDAINLNIMGTSNVLEVARKLHIPKVVLCSSAVLYNDRKGGEESGSLSENNYPRTTTIYASTKLACENLGINYADSYGLEFVALRFRAVFGPWKGKGGGGGPTGILRNLIESSFAGEPVKLSSKQIEFVYSKDAAKAALLAANAKGLKSRVFNVGMGKIYDWKEIANLVKERIPTANIEVEKGEELIPSVKAPPIDLSRSKRELGYEPSYDMPKALDDYISSYKTA